MELLINSDLLNKCGSGSSEYWFSYRDYTVKNIRDLDTGEKPEDMGQTTYFVSIGLIPFITISNEEIIRGFINGNTLMPIPSLRTELMNFQQSIHIIKLHPGAMKTI